MKNKWDLGTHWHFVSGDDDCTSIRSEYDLTPAQFYHCYTDIGLAPKISAFRSSGRVQMIELSRGEVIFAPTQTGVVKDCEFLSPRHLS
jgi:hypothetical protein